MKSGRFIQALLQKLISEAAQRQASAASRKFDLSMKTTRCGESAACRCYAASLALKVHLEIALKTTSSNDTSIGLLFSKSVATLSSMISTD